MHRFTTLALASVFFALPCAGLAQAMVVLEDDFSNNANGPLDGVAPDTGITGVNWAADAIISGGLLAPDATDPTGADNARYDIESELFPTAIITIETTVDVVGKGTAWIGLARASFDGDMRDFGDTDVLGGLFGSGSSTFNTNNPANDPRATNVFFNSFADPDDPTSPLDVTMTYNLATGETTLSASYDTASGPSSASWSGNVLPTGGTTLFPPDEIGTFFLQTDGAATFEDVRVTIVPEPGSLALAALGAAAMLRRPGRRA